MILLEMNLRSAALRRTVPVNILLPEATGAGLSGTEGQGFKTLWLLHGLSGDHTSWMRNTCIERYAAERSLAVVMPSVERSWYADTAYGAGYFTFVTEELPALCRSIFRGMSARREDNLIAGLSMGGYGALKAALTYPERYLACISLSGSVDITRKGRPYDLSEWRANFGFGIENAEALAGGDNDLFALAERLAVSEKPLPRLALWCGTEDALLPANRAFSAHLSALSITHSYTESEGNHSWRWWDEHIAPALDTVLGEG